MKKHTLFSGMLLCMAMTAINSMAQDVPNGNFAEWEERTIPASMGGGTYLTPSGYWDSFNFAVPGTVSKVEGRTTGSYAALLESKTFDMTPYGFEGETFTTSLLVTNSFSEKMNEEGNERGIPCKSIPGRYLTFWYKYEPVGEDAAQVFVQFNEDLVIIHNVTRTMRFRTRITEATSEWKQGYVDLSEDEGGELTSGHGWPTESDIEAYQIDITSSISGLSSHTEGSGAAAPGSKLWITDLAFTNSVTGITSVSDDKQATAKEVFDLTGRRLAAPSHGINIIKMSDGNVKKVIQQ